MLRTETPELTAYKAAIRFTATAACEPEIQRLLNAHPRHLSDEMKYKRRYWKLRISAIVHYTLRHYPLEK